MTDEYEVLKQSLENKPEAFLPSLALPASEQLQLVQQALDRLQSTPQALRGVNAKRNVETVFDMIGGTIRFAMWADENPKEFYQMYSRLLPSALNAQINATVKLEETDRARLRSKILETSFIVVEEVAGGGSE